MLGNLSFCLSFIVLGIWLMKYDSIKRRFVKSSSKSRILALVQSMECSLSKTCLVSADLSNCRCRMSAKCSFLQMEKLRFVLPMYENSLITKTQWTLICDKEQYIKFHAMTATSRTLAKQNAVFPSAKKNT